MMQSAARQWRDRGQPGSIRTKALNYYPETGRANFDQANPMFHAGDSWDVAEAIVYVAAGKFITGEVLNVDGGQACRILPRSDSILLSRSVNYGIIYHMKARQIFRFRDVQGDVTVEMVVWALPKPTPDRLHGLKYRLYCGKDGRCVVRYDNETGKGDHRHYRRREETYAFESVEKLIADFKADCERIAGWVWE